MNKLDFCKYGVQELNSIEVQITEGGVSDVVKSILKPFNPFLGTTFPI